MSKSTPPPLPHTTTVVGYFNNNPYPLQLDCTDLATSRIVLSRKGEYLLTPQGKKLNDPYFERYCRAGMLSKEETTDGSRVPIHYSSRAVTPPPAVSQPGFSGVANTAGTLPAQPRNSNAQVNASGIGTFSMQEANRRGLFAPATAIPDDFGAPSPEPGGPLNPNLPSIADIGKRVPPAKPAKPVSQAPRAQLPPLPQPAIPAADDPNYNPLDITLPPPSLEESENAPVEVIGKLPPPFIPPEAIAQTAPVSTPIPETPSAGEPVPKKNKGGRPRKVHPPE